MGLLDIPGIKKEDIEVTLKDEEDDEMEENAKQICPVCGCVNGSGAYSKGGTTYCCEPCATNKGCECGCCKETKKQK